MPPFQELVNHSPKRRQEKSPEQHGTLDNHTYTKAYTISELADSINSALGFDSLETNAYVNFAVVKAIAYKQTEMYLRSKLSEDASSVTPEDVRSLSLARASFRREIESIGEDEIVLPSGEECYRFHYEDTADAKNSSHAVHLLIIEHLEGRFTETNIRRRLEAEDPNFCEKPPVRQSNDVQAFIRRNIVWRVAGETGKLAAMNDIRKTRYAADYIKSHRMYETSTIVDTIEVDIEKIMQSVIEYIDTREDLTQQVEQALRPRMAPHIAEAALASTVLTSQ